MSRLYIAGPMSGFADFNLPAFFEAAERVRLLGHDVENPADNDGPTLDLSLANALRNKENGATWADYLRRDLVRLVKCDGIVVLPGWQRSQGANLEVDVATRLGMPTYCLEKYEHDGIIGRRLLPRVRALGISGHKRNGKDAVGRILVERHGYVRASFADKLREVVEALDPIVQYRNNDLHRIREIVSGVGWEDAKDDYPEVRRLLQAMGTEAGRKILGDTIWVDLAFRDIPDGARVVFTDVRFPNEAEAIRRTGGAVWRVIRPGHEAPADAHESETALDAWPFDDFLLNNSTLDDLAERVWLALGCDNRKEPVPC